MTENNQNNPEPQNQTTPEQPEQPAQPPQQPEITQEAKNFAVLCHLLGIPGFLGPLIVWLVTREKDPFIDQHGKEAINYQISMIIYFSIAYFLCFVLIGLVLLPALVVVHLIFIIMASVKASNGQPYKYPIAIRFIN